MIQGRWLGVLALLTWGCGGRDKGPATGGIDSDGDGIPDSEDCDPEDGAVGEAGTWYQDSDGDGYGDAGTEVVSCDPPGDDYTETGGDCDDANVDVHPDAEELCLDGVDNNCDDAIDEACPADLCEGAEKILIEDEQVWAPNEFGYLATCDVYVEGESASLTIEDGVTLLFGRGVGLYVGKNGKGILKVQGDSAGVTFSSGIDRVVAGEAPAPGKWTGVTLASGDDGSRLTGLTLRYGGGGGAGLMVGDTDPQISGGAYCDNTGDGIRIDGESAASLSDVTLCRNEGHGLYLSDEAGFAAVDGSARALHVCANTDDQVNVPLVAAAHLSELDTDGGDCALEVTDPKRAFIRARGGAVEDDLDFTAQALPFYISADIVVQEKTNTPTLTLGAGVIFSMEPGTAIDVGVVHGGALATEGTATSPVVFTSHADSPAPGDWKGITFHGETLTALSVLEGASVLYAGGNGKGAIVAEDAGPTLEGVEIAWSDSSGFYVERDTGASVAVSVKDSALHDNADWGLFLESDLYTSLDAFARNSLVDNGLGPLSIPAASAGALDDASVYSSGAYGEEWLVLNHGTIRDSASWAVTSVPYYTDEELDVSGADDPVLSLETGAAVWFGGNGGLTIGYGSDGGLEVNGASLAAADPGRPWSGVRLESRCLATDLRSASVSGGETNLYINCGDEVLVKDSAFTDALDFDLQCTSKATHVTFSGSNTWTSVSGCSVD